MPGLVPGHPRLFFCWRSKRRWPGTSPAMTAEMISDEPYFTAEKRLSNELAGTIGCAPATRASFAGGAAAGSDTVGLNGGRVAAATRVSAGFGAAAGFGTAADGRGVSLASMIFRLAGTAVAVVSAFD